MPTATSSNDVIYRLDVLEAMLNGVMIYVAALKVGITPNVDDPDFRDFVKKHVLYNDKARLKKGGPGPHTTPALGFNDAAAIARIQSLVEEIQSERTSA